MGVPFRPIPRRRPLLFCWLVRWPPLRHPRPTEAAALPLRRLPFRSAGSSPPGVAPRIITHQTKFLRWAAPHRAPFLSATAAGLRPTAAQRATAARPPLGAGASSFLPSLASAAPPQWRTLRSLEGMGAGAFRCTHLNHCSMAPTSPRQTSNALSALLTLLLATLRITAAATTTVRPSKRRGAPRQAASLLPLFHRSGMVGRGWEVGKGLRAKTALPPSRLTSFTQWPARRAVSCQSSAGRGATTRRATAGVVAEVPQALPPPPLPSVA